MSVKPGMHRNSYASRRPAARRPGKAAFSGPMGLAIGLCIGLVIAAGVWRYKSRPALEEVAKVKNPAPLSAREEATDPPPPGSEYTFYDKLKNFEVVIPEKEQASGAI